MRTTGLLLLNIKNERFIFYKIYQKIIKMINDIFFNKYIALDIGCGHGFAVYKLLKNYHAIGVDINYKNAQIAQRRFGVIVCVMDAEKLAFRDDIAQYI